MVWFCLCISCRNAPIQSEHPQLEEFLDPVDTERTGSHCSIQYEPIWESWLSVLEAEESGLEICRNQREMSKGSGEHKALLKKRNGRLPFPFPFCTIWAKSLTVEATATQGEPSPLDLWLGCQSSRHTQDECAPLTLWYFLLCVQTTNTLSTLWSNSLLYTTVKSPNTEPHS